MIRTLLAVALATALVATAIPPLDTARTTRTERLTAGELDRVESAAESLLREESPVEPGEPGPRRALELSVPADSPTTAPVAYLALGGRPERFGANDADRSDLTDGSDVFVFRVAGGRTHLRRVDFDLRVATHGDELGENPESCVDPDDRPVVLRGGETYRLVLRLVRIDDRPTVVVTVRGFKSENGTTPVHARPAGATP